MNVEAVVNLDSADSAEEVQEVIVYECETCHQCFSNKSALMSHNKWKHELDKVLSCEKCQKVFSRSHNLVIHRNNCTGKTNIKCALCDFHGPSKSVVKDHYTGHHNQVLTQKFVEFSTFEDFIKWKEDLECKTKTAFVKTSGSKRLKTGLVTSKYFCHRDGNFCSKSKGLRSLKMLGSNKVNTHCPAEMSVSVAENTVTVKYIDIHLGHSINLGRLNITESEKAAIAQKLALKIPFTEILNEIRESIVNDELNRVHLLTRKDLWNIVDKFNLNHEAVLHKNDCLSVDAWVRHMQSTSNLIRSYKCQGVLSDDFPELKVDDFFLVLMNDSQLEILKQFGDNCICVDGTHGLNAYDFQLYTVMVLDNMHEGFPCSFLFSNRGDTIVMQLFFKCIKECLNGLLINTKTFMSDMDDTFYNAWSGVFGQVEHRLFCSWHVDRAWRNNLSKIKNKEKQIITYKKLKVIMFEVDLQTLNVMIDNFYHELSSDPETKDFCKYFEKYINSVNSWAYCFRKQCGINTNMNLENMHKVLKYIYFDGKKVKRMDKAIFMLMRYIRDKLFDRLVTLHKGKISNKIADLRNKHKCSLTLKNTVLQVENYWTVGATKNNDVYKIESTNSGCTCNIRCNECECCIHSYTCSCIDYSIKWSMCKHIHLVAMYLKNLQHLQSTESNNILIPCSSSQELDSENVNSIVSELSSNSASFIKDKQHLFDIFVQGFNKIQNYEQLQAVTRQVAPINSIIDALSNESGISLPTPSSHEPANKRVEGQKFKSTKKRNKRKIDALTNPTNYESEKISLAMSSKKMT